VIALSLLEGLILPCLDGCASKVLFAFASMFALPLMADFGMLTGF
jgi:hypothetical protein